MHTKYPLFQIFYSTTFTVLFIILLCLVLITPGDIIRQALRDHQVYSIFIIGGVYILTLLFTIIIYGSRLFTNRSVLASIPKAWIPIEEDDLLKRRKVWKMIAEGVQRSTWITRTARPRDLARRTDGPAEESLEQREQQQQRHMMDDVFRSSTARNKKRGSKAEDEGAGVLVDPDAPFWGPVEHPGWSAPSTKEFPSLHYQAVISELPHLLEAKAVSLAPHIPSSASDHHDHHHHHHQIEGEEAARVEAVVLDQDQAPPTMIPHPAAIALIRRAISMGMREYISHLVSLDLIESSPETCAEFLALYERARFSGLELVENEFRVLMNRFTVILRGMDELSAVVIARVQAEEEEDDDDGDDGRGPAEQKEAQGRRPSRASSRHTFTSMSSLTDGGEGAATGGSGSSANGNGSTASSSAQWRQMITAPTTPYIAPPTESPSSMSASESASASASASSSSSSSTSSSRRPSASPPLPPPPPVQTQPADAQSIASTISSVGSVVRYPVSAG